MMPSNLHTLLAPLQQFLVELDAKYIFIVVYRTLKKDTIKRFISRLKSILFDYGL